MSLNPTEEIIASIRAEIAARALEDAKPRGHDIRAIEIDQSWDPQSWAVPVVGERRDDE